MDFEPKAQVWLVRTEPQHGVGVGKTRKRRLGHLPVGELAKQTGKELLDHSEDILLLDEGHLEIELVEFARGAIGAGIFVAEAGAI